MYKEISPQGIELIKKFEGFKPKPYLCAAKHLTIGYGHKIKEQEKFTYLNEDEAELLLLKDLTYFINAVEKYIKIKLNINQFDAIVSFTYNVGAAALQRSTLRQKLNYGDSLGAAEEFNKWIYVGGKKIFGLVIRRKVESQLFLS